MQSISRPSSKLASEPGQASLGRAFMTFATHSQFARSNVPITAARADVPSVVGPTAHRDQEAADEPEQTRLTTSPIKTS